MKVTMTEYRADQWYEDGAWRSYPPVGEVLDTSPVHAASLCAQGYAKPVAQKDADVETRKEPTPPVAAPQDTAKAKTTAKPAKG